MPKINQEIIQAIKEYPIQDIICNYLDLKPSGIHFKAYCPFHDDKSPSFHINTEKNYYYCFGCKETGDIIDFVQKYNNVTFVQAMEELSSYVGGIAYEKQEPNRSRIRPRKKHIKPKLIKKFSDQETLNACEILTEFFIHQKNQSNNSAAKYMLSRNITADVVEQERIGYAPDQWDYHKHFPKGLSINLLEDIGVIKKRKDNQNSYYSVLRNRIILPIITEEQKVIGFNSRALDNQEAKYLTTRNTSIYTKGNIWYGLNNIFTGVLFIVEGHFDVLSLKSLGYDAICPQGSSIRQEQVKQINQRKDLSQIVVAFDNDTPGKKATREFLKALDNPYASIYLLKYPKNTKDPSELISSNYSLEDQIILLEECRQCIQSNEREELTLVKNISSVEQRINKILNKINNGTTDPNLFHELNTLKQQERKLKEQRMFILNPY